MSTNRSSKTEPSRCRANTLDVNAASLKKRFQIILFYLLKRKCFLELTNYTFSVFLLLLEFNILKKILKILF